MSQRSGEIHHSDDGRINVFQVSSEIADFIVTATFTNPYSCTTGAWDYGIAFRDNPKTENDFHAVTLSCYGLGQWDYFVREGSITPTNRESVPASLNLGQGESNEISLIVLAGFALLSINGSYIAELDISRGSSTENMWLGAGFYSGNARPGYSTGYNFHVWALE